MTDRPDPPIGTLPSLPLTILLGTAAAALVIPFLRWLALVILSDPIPPWPVWVDFVAIKAVAGACVVAAAYAARRVPDGWRRSCVRWALFLLLIESDVGDFASESLGYWLLVSV